MSILSEEEKKKMYKKMKKEMELQKMKQSNKSIAELRVEKNKIRCSKCGSTQITANKKGFGVGKSITGVALLGGIGVLGGAIGSNKIFITCLNCGHKWQPGNK